ncbi:MAG: HEAT repeat domain-containing protein, partial [Myxococcota bacterium]
SGSWWMLPYVASLLEDPYPSVRYMAGRALRTLPQGEGVDYDYISPASERRRVRAALWRRWTRDNVTRGRTKASVFVEGGRLRSSALERLVRRRDDAPTTINE